MESTFDRSYADDILPDRLEKFMKELEADVRITEGNIHDKTLTKPAIAAKWARYSYEEEKYKKKIEDKINDLKNSVAEKLYEKKKSSVVNQSSNETLIKLEVEKLVKKYQPYIEAKAELDAQDDIIRFIGDARQIISQFGYDIKNSIDVLKLENI